MPLASHFGGSCRSPVVWVIFSSLAGSNRTVSNLAATDTPSPGASDQNAAQSATPMDMNMDMEAPPTVCKLAVFFRRKLLHAAGRDCARQGEARRAPVTKCPLARCIYVSASCNEISDGGCRRPLAILGVEEDCGSCGDVKVAPNDMQCLGSTKSLSLHRPPRSTSLPITSPLPLTAALGAVTAVALIKNAKRPQVEPT